MRVLLGFVRRNNDLKNISYHLLQAFFLLQPCAMIRHAKIENYRLNNRAIFHLNTEPVSILLGSHLLFYPHTAMVSYPTRVSNHQRIHHQKHNRLNVWSKDAVAKDRASCCLAKFQTATSSGITARAGTS